MPSFIRRWVTFAIVALCTIFLLIHLSTVQSLSLAQPQQALPVDRNSFSSHRQEDQQDDHQIPLDDDTSTKSAPFNWADLPPRNPVTNMIHLPNDQPADIPRIQYDFSTYAESSTHKQERLRRLAAIKEAFQHSWEGYRENAWLHDEVKPVSGNPYDPFGGWGATLVDTLDSLWILGFEKDFAVAVAALEKIDFSRGTVKELNIFETTIRYMGGFMAAYDLSGAKYPVLLKKAIEVAELIYRAFDTPNRMPITRWDWQKYLNGVPQLAPKLEIIAEIGSFTLEFTRLSQLTGDPKYFDAVQRISKLLSAEQNLTHIPGMWPLSINPLDENFHTDTTFTAGGMADSVYEYLPKEYILLQGRDPMYATMHNTAVRAMKEYLIFEPLLPPTPKDTSPAYFVTPHTPLVLGTTRFRIRGQPDLDPRGEHLTCFSGGMFALAARALSPVRPAEDTAEDLEVANRLAQGCVWSYSATPTKIGPEIFSLVPCRKGRDAVSAGAEPDYEGKRGDCVWSRDRWIAGMKKKPRNDAGGAWQKYIDRKHLPEGITDFPDTRYILRPEAVESLFILWRITGDEAFQDAAWAMFEAVVRWTRTDIAFSAIPDVTWAPPGEGDEIQKMDGMESFWTAETLKYYYLLFAEPDLVSLDEFVFNTEAHPFRWRKEAPRT